MALWEPVMPLSRAAGRDPIFCQDGADMEGETALMVHADDFGKSSAVNQGVLCAFQAGVVTATAIMANGGAADEASQLARAHPSLAVGLHINLTEGRPLRPPARVHSLVDHHGFFRHKNAFFSRCLAGMVQGYQVRDEILAQIEWAMARGLKPGHVNAHHHIHVLPVVAEAIAETAGQGGIRWVRTISAPIWRGPLPAGIIPVTQQLFLHRLSRRAQRDWTAMSTVDHFWGFEFARAADRVKMLRSILESLGPGRHELMCHPARHPQNSGAAGEAECAALCHAETRAILQSGKIRLFAPPAGGGA